MISFLYTRLELVITTLNFPASETNTDSKAVDHNVNGLRHSPVLCIYIAEYSNRCAVVNVHAAVEA